MFCAQHSQLHLPGGLDETLCHSPAGGRAPAPHAWRPGETDVRMSNSPSRSRGATAGAQLLNLGPSLLSSLLWASCQTSWSLGVLICKMKIIIVHVPRLVRITRGGACRASGEPGARGVGVTLLTQTVRSLCLCWQPLQGVPAASVCVFA